MEKQFIGTTDSWVVVRGLLNADGGFSIPKFSSLPTPEDTSLPWLIEKDGDFYRWSTTAAAWIQIGDAAAVSWGNIIGTLSDQTDLQAALDAKEDLITPGTSDDYIRGDKTVDSLANAVIAIGDPRYLKLDDVEDAVLAIAAAKFEIDTPLEFYMVGDVKRLRIRTWEPTFNASHIQSVPVKVGMPAADGDVLTWNAGMGYAEWKAPL